MFGLIYHKCNITNLSVRIILINIIKDRIWEDLYNTTPYIASGNANYNLMLTALLLQCTQQCQSNMNIAVIFFLKNKGTLHRQFIA